MVVLVLILSLVEMGTIQLVLTAGDDYIYGGSGADVIDGGNGSDTIFFRGDGFLLEGVRVNLYIGLELE